MQKILITIYFLGVIGWCVMMFADDYDAVAAPATMLVGIAAITFIAHMLYLIWSR